VLDTIEFVIEFAIGEPAADVEGGGLLALALQRFECPSQGDRLGLGYRALSVSFGRTVEFVEDVARVPQPGEDVLPDGWLDGVHPHRARWAATLYRTSFD
jgi:hypothetical protein